MTLKTTAVGWAGTGPALGDRQITFRVENLPHGVGAIVSNEAPEGCSERWNILLWKDSVYVPDWTSELPSKEAALVAIQDKLIELHWK